MIIEYIQNGKRISYITEPKVVVEEIAELRKDSTISKIWLNGERKK